MRIAVVGGGMMGLVAAERLVRAGRHVTLFDRETQLGGLCTWYDYGPSVWDKFYHVILPSDRLLIELIREIGLGDEMVWRPSRTGYYRDGRHYSISDNLEFVRFPLLTLTQKVRLAWTILYGSRVADWRPLERMTSEEWLLKHSGRTTYETFWRPLLRAKLGDQFREVSAVFIWSYIKRLFSARDPSVGKEQLGHVRGGYRIIIGRLEERIRSGGEIRIGTGVDQVQTRGDGGLDLIVGGDRERFDRVIFTGPVTALQRVCGADLVEVQGNLDRVRYLGVICLVLLTNRPLTPFYVVNIADEDNPFTGVVGMSSVVPESETGGRFITYFPKYLTADNPLFDSSDNVLFELFMPSVRQMFPDLAMDDIVCRHINRARIVQPLQIRDYSRHVPKARTRHPGLFFLNTGHFVNNTVHNNEVVKLVTGFFSDHAAAFSTGE